LPFESGTCLFKRNAFRRIIFTTSKMPNSANDSMDERAQMKGKVHSQTRQVEYFLNLRPTWRVGCPALSMAASTWCLLLFFPSSLEGIEDRKPELGPGQKENPFNI